MKPKVMTGDRIDPKSKNAKSKTAPSRTAEFMNSRSTPMPVFTFFRPLIPALRNTARQIVALTLVFASVFVIGPFAIGPAAPVFAQAVAAPMMLHITILDGEDALNDIRERTAREPIVQVEDENHKPVAGALILFTIQNGGTGASGSFSGLSALSVTTDAQGRAIAHGLKPNGTEGTYTIGVTATLGPLVATAIIHQANIVGAGGAAPSVPSAPETLAPETPVTAPAAPAPPSAPPPAPAGPVTETPAPTSGGGSTAPTKVRKFIRHVPKKVWITGATIVTAGVVVGVVVATHGSNPTTITPGTGTVGP